MWWKDISRHILRSECGMQMKIARKFQAAHRQKKNLYEFLCFDSGEHSWKNHPTTSIIKQLNEPEVRVRNSYIAKFVTKHEKDTELALYANRRPHKLNQKTLEQKLQNQKKDLLRKDFGSKKMKRSRKQTDGVCVISSGRSCNSVTSNVGRTLKMRVAKKNQKHDVAFQNRSNLTHILHFIPAKTVAAQSTQSSSAGPSPPHISTTLKKESVQFKLAIRRTQIHLLLDGAEDN